MFDLIIKNGKIIDGNANPIYTADIGILKGQIARIGEIDEASENIIDATGYCVCPGFIDFHSHSDFSLLANPRAESKIRQGITTEVIGNCGDSAAPVLREKRDLIKEKTQIDGYKIQWDWLSMKDYLSRIKQQGVAVNIVPLIGHNTIRAAVMGYEERAPDPTEMARMKELIIQAMDEGARGLSSGLIYAPGCYATRRELVELAQVVSEKKGLYASHMRSEGNELIEAVKETLSIGKETGVSVHISHHKATGESNWGKVTQTLALMDEANESGLDVTADQYPYTASSTGLTSILPYWMLAGSVPDILKRLKSNLIRDRLKDEITVRPDYFENTYLSCCENNPEFEGMNLMALAASLKTDILTAVFDLLIQENTNVNIVSFAMSEKDVCTVMRHPKIMFGSDGQALADYGVLHKGKPHPRNYGTFPRIIKKYVKQEKVLSLEEAVRKMTSLPAQRLGLTDRGQILAGKCADITIFNLETIRDRATFSDPHLYPDGIEYVLVNGECVISKGDHTGKLPGIAL